MINNSDYINTVNLGKISLFKKKKTLDELISDSTTKKEFKEFSFPKDFSFQNEEHRKAVARLYCRKNYKSENREQRDLKLVVRDNYREKCKEYFIEQYGWPKKVSGLVAGMVFLPNCRDYKSKAGYVASFIPAALGGHLPIRYAEPLSKMMNVEREYLTASSIAWDMVNLAVAGYISIKIWKGENHQEDLVEKMYSIFDGGKDVFKWIITTNAIARASEIPVRLFKYIKDKSHTYSPAAFFPLNPNPVDGIPLTYLMGHDLYRKFRERTKNYDISLNGMKKGFRKEAFRA